MPVEKAPQTVFTLLEDGTGVLLNLETLVYYSLNRTAVALWREIEQPKPPTLDALVEAICALFNIDDDNARQSVSAFVKRLEELKMVRLS